MYASFMPLWRGGTLKPTTAERSFTRAQAVWRVLGTSGMCNGSMAFPGLQKKQTAPYSLVRGLNIVYPNDGASLSTMHCGGHRTETPMNQSTPNAIITAEMSPQRFGSNLAPDTSAPPL